jgi:hypothetical protein
MVPPISIEMSLSAPPLDADGAATVWPRCAGRHRENALSGAHEDGGTRHEAAQERRANLRWPRRADLQAFSRSADDKRAARLLPEASQYLPIEATDDADLQAD